MRRYETICILRPGLGESEISKIIESTSKIITDAQGTIIAVDRWGIKKLAYLIKKESQGYYVLCDYAVSPEAVFEMERKFRIDDAVLKYMTVKLADEISEEEITAAAADAEEKQAEAQEEAEQEDGSKQDTEAEEETAKEDKE
ncbi:MAG: 30S ribosomal protein S6 [Deltaproteobacteria bacterium]|nr:MAG: 30S ribosomal protein S6 [Deltaproteobacteria bacterium]